jgi:hypothetical protein
MQRTRGPATNRPTRSTSKRASLSVCQPSLLRLLTTAALGLALGACSGGIATAPDVGPALSVTRAQQAPADSLKTKKFSNPGVLESGYAISW